MNLSMFNRFCPSLKAMAQLEERVDLSKFNRNEERYVIPMHIKSFWTNKWMQEPRNIFLQVEHCDPSAQYIRGWGTFKIERGLTLCYNCRRLGHISKEFLGAGPICLYCKIFGHEVEDCPRIIAKFERMNVRQENYEESQETKSMLGSHKEKELEKVQTTLVQLKEMMDVHKDVSLPEILKVKQCISTRIEDFDIDCVLDEET
jgi:hypothetical protein